MKQAVVSGRLGQPIELKHVGANNTALAEFDLAVREWDHQKRENVTVWIPCQAWAQQAEFLAGFADVGDTIIVQGELVVDTWESSKYTDESGKSATFKKTVVKAALGGVELVKKSGGEGNGSGAPAAKPASKPKPAPIQSPLDVDEDDVPF